MNSFERIMHIRMGGGVERGHTVRHHGSYSVGAHSWGVAVLMYVLWPEDFERLVSYCIFHDVPEAWVGDLPAPTKKFDPAVKSACDNMEARVFGHLMLPDDAYLSEEDRDKLQACDSLELYFWAQEQVHGGNRHAITVIRELDGFFARKPLLPEAHVLLLQIMSGSVEYSLFELYRDLFPRS